MGSPETLSAFGHRGCSWRKATVAHGRSQLDQFRQRIGVFQQILRTAGMVGELSCHRVNSKMTVKRGEDLAEVNGTVGDCSSMLIGCPNDLSITKAATGKKTATNGRPVVTPGVFVDLWCTAEFSPGDDGNVLVQSAFVEILDQR